MKARRPQAMSRFFRPAAFLRIEELESRTLPDAANIFAAFRGELVAGELRDTVRVHLTGENFPLGGHATLGFLVTPGAGSGLQPDAVRIDSLAPGNVPAILSKVLPNGSSLVLAKLGHGDHDVHIGGINSTTGAWQLQTFLAGDVTGDFVVNDTDHDLLRDAVNGTIPDPGFLAEGDADRDGRITGYDLARASENRGVSTSVRVLTVTAALDPGSDTGVAGDDLVNRTPVNVVGLTLPGVGVYLDADGDGFDDDSALATTAAPTNYLLRADLAPGANTLRVEARDSFGQTAQAQTVVTYDDVAPFVNLVSPAQGAVVEGQPGVNVPVEFGFSEPMIGPSVLAALSVSGNVSGPITPINPTYDAATDRLRFELSETLTDTAISVQLAGTAADLAGNGLAGGPVVLNFTVNRVPTVTEVSPADGEEMVGLAREVIVRFSGPVDPATVNAESFYLIANGERVTGAITVSATERFATFYPANPLPSSTEVRVVVEGDRVRGRSGKVLDGDGDGTEGGTRTADFRTLPLTRIAGTTVFGYVYDSFNRNPDGSDRPVVGATIRVDAFPNVTAVTDATGRFELHDMPAPEFFVHIDGTTATNAPAGFGYPSVGKPFHSVPGQAVQISMDGKAFDIYLPPMATGDVVPLSPTEPTDVGFGDAGKAQLEALFPAISPAVWDRMTVTYPANSAMSNEGIPATKATVIPVAPDRIPAPLPPNLNPQLVVSIQAMDALGREVTNFDVPAPVTFPNLEGLAPGEKSLIFSFNHDAGRWDVIGTGTVSADGLMVVSDPGVGIRAPGWHFVQFGTVAPGSPGGDFFVAAQFQDFLVGPGQPPISVRIVTNPENSTVSWAITPVGAHSGTVANNTGTAKEFSFTPDVTGVRPTNGTQPPHPQNPAVEYQVTYTVTTPDGETFTDTATITQNIRARLRQEYVDYGLNVPALEEVAPSISTTNFQGAEFSANSNYSPWVINGGMQEIAQNTRNNFLQPINISSAYRNPQRNRGVGGVDNSVHMSGGAVDMQPGGTGTMVGLYSAALTVNPGLVLLEQGPRQLLPGNWRPPDANHTFTVGTSSVAVVDTDGDGLPDSVSSIQNPPAGGIPFNTNLAYAGGGTINPHFRVVDSNDTGIFDVGDSLVLRHQVANVPALNNPQNSLASYFANASHVHADNQQLVAGGNQATGAALFTLNAGQQVSTSPGFGIDDRLYYRFSFGNGLEVAGRSNASGAFSEVLSPNSPYSLSVYQASTNRSGEFIGVTSASGAITNLGPIFLDKFGGPDADGDGIPDVGELAIGTSPTLVDTDGDGISDDAEISQGLDPLDGRAFPTGIISSLPLRGEAREVVVEGSSLAAGGLTAYAATGSYGLAIVDTSQFNNPIVLGQLDLPGDATDVAVDSNLQIAAVAANSGGLHFVNIADPMTPVLLRTISVSAGQVEVVQGVAYATVGNSLRAYDLLTGAQLENLTLPGGTLTGLAREGTFLYTMDNFRTLRAIDVGGFNMAARGSLNLPHGGGKLFVGNGIAYAPASNSFFRGGFATANVSNPDGLTLISGSDVAAPFVGPGTAVAANGSGIAALIGSNGGVNSLDLMNIADPANTNAFLLRINLPTAPLSVALASGIAFVADGTSGLQVINYLPFDNKGVAPTVAASATAADLDPNTDGVQVLEGTSIPIAALVADDVQLRNAELLVNGQVVANDVSFPFDFVAIAPNITGPANTFTVQVRATDTGGNPALSDVLTFGLVEDIFAPTIASIEPPTNASRVEPLQTVQVRFSESMAAATLTTQTIRLRDADGNVFTPTSFQVRNDDRFAQLTFAPLTLGSYEIVLSAATITDRAGNPLGAADFVSPFALTSRASIATAAADDDPAAPGLQVFEGRTLPLTVTVVPGVAVQMVEFLLDGQVIATDTEAPFTAAAVAPNIAPGVGSLTLQARVTDTAGLATLTNTVLVGLLEDVTPPVIAGFEPATDGTAFEGLQVLKVNFSEPLAVGSVTVANFELFEAGPDGALGTGDDVSYAVASVQFANDDTQVRLATASLPIGFYRLRVLQDGITDRAGNPLGTGAVESDFELLEQVLVNGGFEDGFTNWTLQHGFRASIVGSYTGDRFYAPKDGDRFTLLRSGFQNVFATASQQFTARAGDTIAGWAFFDTTDYLPFSDSGYVRILSDGVVVATPFFASISTVGSFGSTDWTSWQYTFTTGGAYTIQAGVANGGDSGVDSFLGLDAIEVLRGSPLTATIAGPAGGAQGVSAADATVLAGVAAQLWSGALGLLGVPEIAVQVVDLPHGYHGLASVGVYNPADGRVGGTVLIDVDANGVGWFVDPTPWEHSEFGGASPAAGRYDLLTVLLHEIGHLLGHEHAEDGDDVMAETLSPGVRHLPLTGDDWADSDDVFLTGLFVG